MRKVVYPAVHALECHWKCVSEIVDLRLPLRERYEIRLNPAISRRISMSKTVTITITADGPDPQEAHAAQGDFVVWANPTANWYSVWDFQGPSGSPALFQQAGYGIDPWAASGGEVISDAVGDQYSYSCTAESGGIIIVDPPKPGAPVQKTAQKSVQSSSSTQAGKALATNGSRK
jgi:hypothetical protein